ncbi:MAG: asparagine synthase (glutamine-hydrolyzing) [bacterium]|nr:MAG: asparagine synthase (glutamine-hydrolyzing) [bacterium]
MCGICGTAGFGDPATIREMARSMIHRGPDDEGYFESTLPAVYLANRRLSIIDVEGGRQPVYSEDRSVVAVQNGEIYNFRELRKDLESRGHTFNSLTDSEVIPHLYQEYGEDFPQHLDGMFAIALWDSSNRKLLLVRDHVGIKPLYLWQREDQLAFASEVKAFMPLRQFTPRLDLDGLHFLLNVRFVPGERTLFGGVRMLPPATVLVWETGGTRERRFWELPADPDPSIKKPEEGLEQTRYLLARAVRKQMVSDVPLGLYLSGGMDSSSLVAMAANNGGGAVKTYSLGFNEPTDELADSRLVAEAFATDHHETTISFDALSIMPEVTWHVEEPKENAIQLYLLSRYASGHVKVALSGLGGDELFGGYRIFDYARPMVIPERFAGRSLNRTLLWPLRNFLSVLTGNLGSMKWDLARRAMDGALSLGVPERWYPILRNMWEHDRRLFKGIYTSSARKTIETGVESFFAPFFAATHPDIREEILRTEFRYKMVDDFLLNEDKTSMANSLEVRVPFLDRELVEFAFSIPARVKFSGGHLKVVLKKAMEGILPERTLQKPKWGFTFDSYYQFQKDLRYLAERQLTREFMESQGIFQHTFIRGILDHPPHRWMRWHYFLLWLILGVKVWQDLFIFGKKPDECYGT